MQAITISNELLQQGDLVLLPKKEYNHLLNFWAKYNNKVTEEDILEWSKEAKQLHQKGELQEFKTLIKKDYPQLANKYKL